MYDPKCLSSTKIARATQWNAFGEKDHEVRNKIWERIYTQEHMSTP